MSTLGNISQTGIHRKIDLVSNEMLATLQTVNLAILTASVSLFGIVSNIVNIVIFFKQGIRDTVNIGLVSLAISDLLSLVTLEWVCLIRNPLFINKVPLIADEVLHLSAAWPQACFGRITSCITVYITLERCLCVVIPLKIKRFVTPTVTTCVIVIIAVLSALTLIPEYITCYLDWKRVPGQNRSLVGLVFLSGRDLAASLSFNLNVGPQIATFGAVIVITGILVFKMQQITKWRHIATNVQHSSKKDTRAVKMIILVAIIYCVCFLPMVVIVVTITVVPEFIAFRNYHNSFFAAWSFAFVFYSINSSINVVVYYKMSTKYRQTFNLLFSQKIHGN